MQNSITVPLFVSRKIEKVFSKNDFVFIRNENKIESSKGKSVNSKFQFFSSVMVFHNIILNTAHFTF